MDLDIYRKIEFENAIEAILFTMGKSVELRQLAAALECDLNTTRNIVLGLKKKI